MSSKRPYLAITPDTLRREISETHIRDDGPPMDASGPAADGTFYQLLRLTEFASLDQIKRAFRKLAIRCHPDLLEEESPLRDEFRRICEAYCCLSDERSRQQYDQELTKASGVGSRVRAAAKACATCLTNRRYT